jgi:hypothetical protein
MKNGFLITICITITFFSCSDSGIDKSKSFNINYDYEVLYRFQGEDNIEYDKYRSLISSDSLYFIFESEFRNDSVLLEVDNKLIFEGVVNTEASSGIAQGITIGNIENVKNLIIRINSGPKLISL